MSENRNYYKILAIVVIALSVVISAVFLFQMIGKEVIDLWKYGNDPDIRAAEKQERLDNIHFEAATTRIFKVLTPLVLLTVGGWGALALVRVKVKRSQYHTANFGPDRNVEYHESQQGLVVPAAFRMANALELEGANVGYRDGLHDAGKIRKELDADLRQSQRAVQTVEQSALNAAPETIPTFHDLLLSGELAEGKPMILGYEHGQPRRGSFLDIYSAAVAGESGSGKTLTMLFLVGSGIVCDGVQFLCIDPHYPHPKSFGMKAKPLVDAGLIELATDFERMTETCVTVQGLIDSRMALPEDQQQQQRPVVLVIDELAFLAKTQVAEIIFHTMERISTEGRKCEVYMLASSQTWLAARTGGNSIARDTLTSAYVHRIKPKQANLILQDKAEVAKHKEHVKKPGDVLLVPVCDDSVPVKIPYTTKKDITWIAQHVANGETVYVQEGQSEGNNALSEHQDNSPIALGEPDLSDCPFDKSTLFDQFKAAIKQGDLTQEQWCETHTLQPTYLSKILAGNKPLSDKYRLPMQALIKKHRTVIPFPST